MFQNSFLPLRVSHIVLFPVVQFSSIIVVEISSFVYLNINNHQLQTTRLAAFESSKLQEKQNRSLSETTDLVAKFLVIAPHSENQAIFPPGEKYETPDFVNTVLSMREKLYQLQGDLGDAEEPQVKDILKRWKASNSIIYFL